MQLGYYTDQLSTTTVNTFPCRFNKPNTATFPAAPRPRFPLRGPPK